MAYGLKYTSSFHSTNYGDVSNKEYLLHLEYEGFVGSATDIKINGFEAIDKANDDREIGLKPLRFKFGVVSDTLTIEDFFVENSTDVRFKLFEVDGGNTLVHIGFLSEEDAREAYIDGTKVIQVSANDGIEVLKTTPYKDPSIDYSNSVTLLTILWRCLDNIGHDINLNTAWNYRQSNVTPSATVDPLNIYKKNQEDIVDLTCYDVLKRLTESLNCQLIQEDGEWWFIHPIGQKGSPQFFRKWSHTTGTYISGGTIGTSSALHDSSNKPFEGTKSLEKAIKKIVSRVELSEYKNQIPNADFQINTGGIPDTWNSNVDGFGLGGSGTVDDPYYGQVDGYQEKSLLYYTQIKKISTPEILLADVANGDDLDFRLNRKVRIKGSVKGNDVREAFVGVILKIETSSLTVPVVYFILNSAGDWIRLGQFSISTPNINHLNHAINIGLVNKEGNNFDEYSEFDVSSYDINDIIIKNRTWSFFLTGILGGDLFSLVNLTVDDFTRVSLIVELYEGYRRTDSPQGVSYDEWLRWSGLTLQVIDTNVSKNIEAIEYSNYVEVDSLDVQNIDRYLIDFEDDNQSVAVLDASGVPTTQWITNNDSTARELVDHLNRELLNTQYKPQNLLDCNLRGFPKRRELLTFNTFTEPFINLTWNYDFYNGIARQVRYKKLYGTPPTSGYLKEGVYEGGTKKAFGTNGAVTVVINEDIIVPSPDLPDPDVETQQIIPSLFLKKNADVFDKISWIDESSLVETDYIRPITDGFELKAEGNNNLGIKTDLMTTDYALQAPNLTTDATIATDATAWMLGGNTIGAKKLLGSVDNFDVGVIRNNTEIATIKSTGVDVVGRITAASAAVTGLTTNYLPKVGSGGLLGNSQIYDDGTNVGIGTTSPTAKLNVNGNTIIGNPSGSNSSINFTVYTADAVTFAANNLGGSDAATRFMSTAKSGNRATMFMFSPFGGSNTMYYGGATSFGEPITEHQWWTGTAGSTGTGGAKMILSEVGNLGIGTSPSTERLNVNGTTKTTNLKITNGAAVGYLLQATNVDGSSTWVDPANLIQYKGTWNPSTNTPTLVDGTGTVGDYYRIIGTASRDLGSGSIEWTDGYDIRYNGSIWEELPVGSLVVASSLALGSVKVGTTLEIAGDGTLNQKTGVATAGTYKSVTVDTYGRVTAGTNPTTISGYGITDAYTQTEINNSLALKYNSADFNTDWDTRYGTEHSQLNDKTIPYWDGDEFLNSPITVDKGAVSVGTITASILKGIGYDIQTGTFTQDGSIYQVPTLSIDNSFAISSVNQSVFSIKPDTNSVVAIGINGTLGATNQVLIADRVNGDRWASFHTGYITDWSNAWDVKMASFIGAAPEALDTWLELVAEIQDNDSAIAAINNTLSQKYNSSDFNADWLNLWNTNKPYTLAGDPNQSGATATWDGYNLIAKGYPMFPGEAELGVHGLSMGLKLGGLSNIIYGTSANATLNLGAANNEYGTIRLRASESVELYSPIFEAIEINDGTFTKELLGLRLDEFNAAIIGTNTSTLDFEILTKGFDGDGSSVDNVNFISASDGRLYNLQGNTAKKYLLEGEGGSGGTIGNIDQVLGVGDTATNKSIRLKTSGSVGVFFNQINDASIGYLRSQKIDLGGGANDDELQLVANENLRISQESETGAFDIFSKNGIDIKANYDWTPSNGEPIKDINIQGHVNIQNSIVMTTPDGNNQYRVTIDNSGNVITTLI